MNDRYDVLLTYPAENIRLFEPMIPLGIASIAAVLEQNGFSVKIVDFSFYRGDYYRDLKKWQPKIIGVGGTTPTRRGSFLTARISKKVLPDVPVVYGGVHASFTAKDSLDHVPQIDFVVKGEGERTFLALCEHYVNGKPIDIYSLPGLCYRNNRDVIENTPQRIQDIDTLPIPARHLFEYTYSMSLDCNNMPADFIMTSRGCPAACTFCSASRMFPGGVRLRSMRSVQQEIDLICANKKIQALKLFDSTFTAVRDHVLQFCTLIQAYDLQWECEIRADTVDFDLLQRMKKSGCCFINVGLETINKQLLTTMGKNISVSQVESVLAWCKKLDIRTKVFFIFGHPGETYRDCLKDLAYIRTQRNLIDFFATTIGLRIYPGTALEKWARTHNSIPADFSWACYRAPLKNYWVLEPGDVIILDQKELSLMRLASLILRLCLQGTVLSGNYIQKMAWSNCVGIVASLQALFRHTRHRIERLIFNAINE